MVERYLAKVQVAGSNPVSRSNIAKLSSLNICNILTLAQWLRFRVFLIPRTFCFIGWVAEWLCSGLQLRVRRFDSDLSLQFSNNRSIVEIGNDKGLETHSGVMCLVGYSSSRLL